MSKLVVLKLGEGDFEERGFPVTLRITDNETSSEIQRTGKLPPDPKVLESYESWRYLYDRVDYPEFSLRGLSKKGTSDQVTSGNKATSCKQAGEKLSKRLNEWLTSSDFSSIRENLLQNIKPDDNIRIILQTDNLLLQNLPWSEWRLLAGYKNIEIVFSPSNYENPPKQSHKNRKRKIKLLFIIGEKQDIDSKKKIDLDKDRKILKQQLPDADIEELVQPKRRELCEKIIVKKWDIIFFAGHGSQDRENLSSIKINRNDCLSIKDLKYALSLAIEKGLSLAIFNSCDGLGLAADLADLKIPQTIVMRKRIADDVAHEFLKQFLGAFARNHSVHLAVREARERLHGLENEYPCASWLPVIFENPAYQPLTWVPRKYVPKLPTVIVASLVVASLMSGIRHLGVLQPLELMAYDWMMQMRPDEKDEKKDYPILVVEVTKDDINAESKQERSWFSLSNAKLIQAIDELNKHHAQVIGLDMYRDSPTNDRPPADVEKLFKTDNLFTVCKVKSTKDGDIVGTPPAPFIPLESLGFSDVVYDSAINPSDKIPMIRRHLLFMNPDSGSLCKAHNSLSWQLAERYLDSKNIKPQQISDTELQLGKAHFEKLSSNAGGYQGIDNSGFQILLNYRNRKKVAGSVTVTSLTNGQVSPNDIKGKVILIGVTDPARFDDFQTPYGTQIRGVFLQAQMVSQLIDAALGNRPLLRVLSWQNDFLWICSWSCVGGLIVWQIRGVIPVGVVLIVAIAMLSGLCFFLFCKGTWVPLIPSLLTLLLASGSSILITIFYPKVAEVVINQWKNYNNYILSKNQR